MILSLAEQLGPRRYGVSAVAECSHRGLRPPIVGTDSGAAHCPTRLPWFEPLPVTRWACTPPAARENTDDWLRATFDRLNPDATLTVVMDCCHSGTNTREPLFLAPDAPEPDLLPRFLPNPDDEACGGAFTGTGGRALGHQPDEDVHAVDIIEALVTGCRDRQTSADANIEGVFNGALTYYLVQAMRADPQATYRDLHRRTVEALHGHYDQVPQLESRAARLDQCVLSSRG